MVSCEGQGLAPEITLSGNRRKDPIVNTEHYARLGIPEGAVLGSVPRPIDARVVVM